MLKTLHIRQFTVFRDAAFEFSPGLNVIVGDNGTGKTHVLKLGYLFSRAWTDLQVKQLKLTQQSAETYLGERLAGLFKVPDLEALIRQGHKAGARLSAEVSGNIPTVQIRMASEPPSRSAGLPENMPWDVQILRSNGASGALKAKVLPEVIPNEAVRSAFLPRQVFIPSKEMVSLFKGLIGLFETYRDFPLDDTYRDLAVAMSTLEPREPSTLLVEVVERIRKLLGGNLKLEKDELVFVREDGSILLSQLLAEGHRKLAMLVYLLRYGVIERGSTLFWDEPEANLNPAALKLLAEVLYVLSTRGVQVILATHSLFLLRELEMLLASATHGPAESQFFGLHIGRNGVSVKQGNTADEIGDIVTLDEELSQSDRFLETGA